MATGEDTDIADESSRWFGNVIQVTKEAMVVRAGDHQYMDAGKEVESQAAAATEAEAGPLGPLSQPGGSVQHGASSRRLIACPGPLDRL
ncbi:hypothetical protein MTO96_041711 [Rhipicephalus appendiculatus]